jgi:hypothetical protein
MLPPTHDTYRISGEMKQDVHMALQAWRSAMRSAPRGGSAGSQGLARTSLLVTVAVVLLAALGVALYASLHRPDHFATFVRTCESQPGNTVVTLSTSTRGLYMGASGSSYKVGCRKPNGSIAATITTTRRP